MKDFAERLPDLLLLVEDGYYEPLNYWQNPETELGEWRSRGWNNLS